MSITVIIITIKTIIKMWKLINNYVLRDVSNNNASWDIYQIKNQSKNSYKHSIPKNRSRSHKTIYAI